MKVNDYGLSTELYFSDRKEYVDILNLRVLEPVICGRASFKIKVHGKPVIGGYVRSVDKCLSYTMVLDPAEEWLSGIDGTTKVKPGMDLASCLLNEYIYYQKNSEFQNPYSIYASQQFKKIVQQLQEQNESK